MRTLRILSTVACALLALALVASGGQAAPRRHATAHKAGKAHVVAKHVTRASAKPAATAPGAAGMVVAIDPETGAQRMPTPEELQALFANTPDYQMNTSTQGLVVSPGRTGGKTVDLQGRFLDFTVVRIGADGRPIFGCGSSPAAAIGETFTPNRANGALEDK